MQTFSELWWVLPASVVFSTVAIGSGVSGALFFSPFFMLVVGLAPTVRTGRVARRPKDSTILPMRDCHQEFEGRVAKVKGI